MTIDILIGQDLFWTFMTGNTLRLEGCNVVAQETLFGWVLSGVSGSPTSGGVSLLNICGNPDDVNLSFGI